MAMSLRTLGDLENLCRELGIFDSVKRSGKSSKTSDGKKSLKQDYIDALCDYYLSVDYPEGNIPKYWKILKKIESPMLCNRMQNLKDNVQKEVWESDMWGFQEKLDGARMIIYYDREEGIHFFSRNLSLKNFRFAKYTNIYQPNFDASLISNVDSFIVDTEVICTNPSISTIIGSRGVQTDTMLAAVTALLGLNDEESIEIQKREGCPIQFCLFDTFMYAGEMLSADGNAVKQEDREKVTDFLFGILKNAGMNIVLLPTVYGKEAKKQFYETIIANKGEGVIAKNKNGLYYTTDNRSSVPWVKLKRTISGSLLAKPINDTVDAYIVGFERGDAGKQYENYVGTLHFAVKLKKNDDSEEEFIIAHCGGISFAERKDATIYDPVTNTVSLNPSWLGRVAAIDGQNFSSRAKRIRNARIISWRTDKTAFDCNFSEADINSLIM